MNPRLPLLAGTLALGAGCGFLPETTGKFYQQLEAESPCFEVNILDGLDEQETTEVDNLFACLNYHGHFTAFSPLDTDASSRDNVPLAIEMARMVNKLGDAEVDVFTLAELAIDMLSAEDRPIEAFFDVFLELTYGTRATALRSGVVSATDPEQLRSGVLVPVGEVIPVVAASLLDDDLDASIWAAELLEDPETKRWIATFGDAVSSSDPAVRAPTEDLLPHLGDAIAASRTPANDLWTGASGDSLRDLSDSLLLGSDPVIVQIGPSASGMLSDSVVRTTLPQRLVALHGQNVLQKLGPQLRWMATVDVDTAPLNVGETSSLHAFLRLLAATNKPMQCSLDLWVTSLDVNLGNVAVAILEILADLDPETVQTSTGILGTLLGWDLSEWALYEIADSGVCPVLTPQVMEDIQAVDVMYEDEAFAVLETVIEIFAVMKYGQQNRIPELADFITVVVNSGAIYPVEEAIRDLGPQPLVADVVDLVPVFVNPESYGLDANGAPAVDIQDLLEIVLWLWREDAATGETGLDRIGPLVRPTMRQDATWTALGHAGTLFEDRETQTSRLLTLIPPLLELDPELVVLDTLAPLVGNVDVAAPFLRILENTSFTTTLLGPAPQGDDPETPLAFGSRLILGGTLDDLLHLIDLLFAQLRGEETTGENE